MTAIWGPLGWITLHSVATSYPPVPSPSEQILLSSWLDAFRDTITCSHCREHFSQTLVKYRRAFPNMLRSRQDFSLFTFRVHNAVNKRLKKPVYSTLEECMDMLRNTLSVRSAKEYRVSYYSHILRYWRTLQDINGITALRKIAELRRIEAEYVSSRDTKFDVVLVPDIVVLPQGMLEQIPEESRTYLSFNSRVGTPPTTGLRLTLGGFRARK